MFTTLTSSTRLTATLALALALAGCITVPPTIPDKPGAKTVHVPFGDSRLHGHKSWYADASDTIYVVGEHPIAGCVEILEDHERVHRQQAYRGERIDSGRAEREARTLSMSRNCSDGPRAPVLTMWHFPN